MNLVDGGFFDLKLGLYHDILSSGSYVSVAPATA
jgi:hypothetical protein